MSLSDILRKMSDHRKALLELGGAATPSSISEHTHNLAQYTSLAEEHLAELEEDLAIKESTLINQRLRLGDSVNSAEKLAKRVLSEDRAKIAKVSRLVSSSWRLINESQSRIKTLIAEANNQI